MLPYVAGFCSGTWAANDYAIWSWPSLFYLPMALALLLLGMKSLDRVVGE